MKKELQWRLWVEASNLPTAMRCHVSLMESSSLPLKRRPKGRGLGFGVYR